MYDDDESIREVTAPPVGEHLWEHKREGVIAWYDLLELAERDSTRYVLTGNSYRESTPTLTCRSLKIRSVLLMNLSCSALRSIRGKAALERIGFWPSEAECGDIPKALSGFVLDCLTIVNSFTVEDEESLKALVRACEWKIGGCNTSGKAGDIAIAKIKECLLNCGSEVRNILRVE